MATREPTSRRATLDDIPELLEDVGGGLSFRAACQARRINRRSAQALISADVELQAKYDLARADRADVRVDEGDEVIKKLQAGKLTADQARVSLDWIKWNAARMNPKRWGDKVTNEHSGPNGGAIPMEFSWATTDEEATPDPSRG